MIKSIDTDCQVVIAVERAWREQCALIADQCADLVISRSNPILRVGCQLALTRMIEIFTEIKRQHDLLSNQCTAGLVESLWIDFLKEIRESYTQAQENELKNTSSDQFESTMQSRKMLEKAIDAMGDHVFLIGSRKKGGE